MDRQPVLEEDRTVRVRRRRRTTTSGAGERERADAPVRDQPSTGGGLPPRPPSGPTGPSGPGGAGFGGLPSGPRPAGGGGLGGMSCSPLMIGVIVVVLIIFFIGSRFMGGGEAPLPIEPDATEVGVVQPMPTRPPTPTARPAQPSATPTRVQAAPGAEVRAGQKWLVMLYQDADDKVLEKDIFVDLNEAERVGSSDRVQVVSQIDRFQAGYQGDGNWTSTRRYYVTRDDDLEQVGSEVVDDIGEANMADGNTLVDFVTWAMQSYPADKYVLILSDHGMGWPGGWSDPTARGGGDASLPISRVLGDQLYLSEFEQALGEIRQRTGLDKFELVGLDACLMGHLEVLGALAPHARYAVASQETEPALGWAYAAFLDGLQRNPDITGAELGKLIVDSYIVEDARIVDDEARADLIGRGNALQNIFGIMTGPTAEQVAKQLGESSTLSAVDLTRLPALMDGVNRLAFALQRVNPKGVAQARSYSQSFTSIFGNQVPPSYIDLGHFAQILAESGGDQAVTAAAGDVLGALRQVVLAEKHGPQRAGATGVSVYFPNSQLYRSPQTGPQSYTAVANRFAQDSLWDDYLDFHYTGRSFEAAPAAPAEPAAPTQVKAPGRGAIQVGPVTASAQSVAVGDSVVLRAPVRGENIGYVKLFVGYIDPSTQSINLADSDYLESPRTRQVNGVYFPDWGEGDFTLEFEWEPVVYAIGNGTDTAVALFVPESYGATYQQATYTVDGLYTFADGGETRSARLYFQNEMLRQVFTYTGQNGNGAPWETVPTQGDSFTVLERWLDLDANGAVTQQATENGETLTFAGQTFSWEVLDAPAGEYQVGFIVEDLDGNQTAAFTMIRVE